MPLLLVDISVLIRCMSSLVCHLAERRLRMSKLVMEDECVFEIHCLEVHGRLCAV